MTTITITMHYHNDYVEGKDNEDQNAMTTLANGYRNSENYPQLFM